MVFHQYDIIHYIQKKSEVVSPQLYVCWSHPMDTIVLKGSLVRKLRSYGRMSMVSFVIMSTTAVCRWEQYNTYTELWKSHVL